MNFLNVMELCQTSQDQVIIKVGQNIFSETLYTLDYQSRGRKIDPPLLRSFG